MHATGIPWGRRADNVRKGGDDRIRTDDPLVANQVLYQLSYVPSFVPMLPPRPCRRARLAPGMK
jgi:hypothetical protein